jgi:DNA-binding transcriptional LysR family regulator
VVPVLEEYCPPFPGYYLYYPPAQPRLASAARLIDYLLGMRQRGRASG